LPLRLRNMMERREFLKFVLMCFGQLVGNPLLAYAADSGHAGSGKATDHRYSIRSGHPRLFLTPERIREVRRRCADARNAQAHYYSVMKAFADRYDPDGSKPAVYDCMVLAFLYVVGEVPGFQYGGRSIEDYGRLGAEMLSVLRPPRGLAYFSRKTPVFIACYDWLFRAMNIAEREKIFRNFTAVADEMRSHVGTTGRFRGTREMYAFYGLAFHGDGRFIYPENRVFADAANKKAKEYVDFFLSWHRDRQMTVLEVACKGGAYPAGTMYGEVPYPDKIWIYDAWDTASSENLYENTTFITGYSLFWLHQLIPFRTHVRSWRNNAHGHSGQAGAVVRFGDYRYIGYSSVSGPIINIAQAQGVAAAHREVGRAAAFNGIIQYDEKSGGSPFGGPFSTHKWVRAGPPLVWDVLFRDGLTKAESPAGAGLPLAQHFGTTDSGPPIRPDFPHGRPEGAGIVTMRSSWEDPDGTLLWFKASSHHLIHAHRDQGSFQIYKNGWLAIDSGQYEETAHHGNYSMRSVAHNSLLIYRPGEEYSIRDMDPVWNGVANDGGQRWAFAVNASTSADIHEERHFLGGITRFESKPGVYDYAHANITRAYNSVHVSDEGQNPKVALVTRSLLFLRPDCFVVVFDRVDSLKAQYPKRWLLHSVYRPEINGTESFEGTVTNSTSIPGKPEGVALKGDERGGISESRDTSIFTLRGWNFGPSDGRLVVRTLLPEVRITRLVGGIDGEGTKSTKLVRAYAGGGAIFVASVKGFKKGDFVYLGKTTKPYKRGDWGRPNWPVDDMFYEGWGKIKKVDAERNAIYLTPYRYGIPKLPAGTTVIRSGHANEDSFEFMDAEYTQWPMHGEAVANAGPFNMQHGAWRVEVEPLEKKTKDVFLHVMLPCDRNTLGASREKVENGIRLIREGDRLMLEIEGQDRLYKITLSESTPEAKVAIS
jgi:hypothetical protein